jgi:hypothetical protein
MSADDQEDPLVSTEQIDALDFTRRAIATLPDAPRMIGATRACVDRRIVHDRLGPPLSHLHLFHSCNMDGWS